MKFFLRYQAKYEPEGNIYKMIITSICDPVADNVLVFRSILSHSRSWPEGTDETPMYCRSARKGLSSEVFWKFCSFVVYKKKTHYRQGNRKNIITINFKFKNSSNHIVLSLLKSIDINEERTLILIFFFKIKRKRLQSIIFRITLWNRRVSFPFREM